MAQLTSMLPRLLIGLVLACSGGCWGDNSAADPFQVASSSMAPTLLGPTLSANCTVCQYAFPIAAETYRPRLPTRCLNCGGLCDVDPTVQPGQTVLLEPLANPNDVQRWDLIAFQDLASNTTQVKRVWGLPGESIELRQGEARSDGVMLRKSLAELRQVAVPVYDLIGGGGCQWSCSQAEQFGQAKAGTSADVPPRSLHLLAGERYRLRHVRPAPVHPNEVPASQWLQASPVVDAYSINQGLSTADHPVADGLIQLQLQRPLAGPLRIGVHIDVRGCERIVYVLIHPAAGIELTEPGGAAAISALPTNMSPTAADFRIAGRQRVELGWCDGRLLLETDLQSCVFAAEEIEILPPVMGDPPSAQPQWEPPEICRLTSSHAIDISHFRFSRDLYLTSASNVSSSSTVAAQRGSSADPRWPAADPLAGFYVLGDNLAASRDSRHELGRVLPAQVLGRIVAGPRP